MKKPALPSSTSDPAAPDRDRLPQLKRPKSLKRLRERVGAAQEELARLRRENAALAARIAALEEEAAHDGTIVKLPEQPEALREQVEGFIAAIDAYLSDESPA